MCHAVLQNPAFFRFLTRIDEELVSGDFTVIPDGSLDEPSWMAISRMLDIIQEFSDRAEGRISVPGSETDEDQFQRMIAELRRNAFVDMDGKAEKFP